MRIKIVGKAQIIFQAEERDPYGKQPEFKLELELPADAQWASTYNTAINLFLEQVNETLRRVQWPTS